MSTEDNYGVCPLMGTSCVGEANCAPAKWLALVNRTTGDVINRCPIIVIADALSGLAFAAGAAVEAQIGPQVKVGPDVNQLGREEFIKHYVKTDQELT